MRGADKALLIKVQKNNPNPRKKISSSGCNWPRCLDKILSFSSLIKKLYMVIEQGLLEQEETAREKSAYFFFVVHRNRVEISNK
jgi:hypothetical protein